MSRTITIQGVTVETHLCESCRGSGAEDTSPRFAGDDDGYTPYASGSSCSTCCGTGRYPAIHDPDPTTKRCKKCGKHTG